MTKPDDQKLNCFRLLAELNAAGINNVEAARRLGVAVSTLRGWKAGSEPGYSDGKRLIDLHAYLTDTATQ